MSEATKQSILRYVVLMDCFAALAMTDKLSAGLLARHLPTRCQACDDKIDHLVERRARLVGALRDHLRMEESHHSGADTHGCQRHVCGLEFTRRDAPRYTPCTALRNGLNL